LYSLNNSVGRDIPSKFPAFPLTLKLSPHYVMKDASPTAIVYDSTLTKVAVFFQILLKFLNFRHRRRSPFTLYHLYARKHFWTCLALKCWNITLM